MLLSQKLENIVGQLLGRIVMSQPLNMIETRQLAVSIQAAAGEARALEGRNVIPFPKPAAHVAAVETPA